MLSASREVSVFLKLGFDGNRQRAAGTEDLYYAGLEHR